MTGIQKIAEVTKKINEFKKNVDEKVGKYQAQIQGYMNKAQDIVDGANTKSKKAVMDELSKIEHRIASIQQSMQVWVDERMEDLQGFVDGAVASANKSMKEKTVQQQLVKLESAKSAEEAKNGKTASAAELENKKPLLSEEEQKELCDSLPDPIPAPSIPSIEIPKISIDLKSMVPDVWTLTPDLTNMMDVSGLSSMIPSLPTGVSDKFSFPAASQISDRVNEAIAAKNS